MEFQLAAHGFAHPGAILGNLGLFAKIVNRCDGAAGRRKRRNNADRAANYDTMQQRRARRRRLVSVVAALGIAVCAGVGFLIWAPWAERGADLAYDTSVAQPRLRQRAPRILFDHGHGNAHSIDGRFSPFANLLRADGCRVASTASSSPITSALLHECDVLVVVNARAPKDAPDGSAMKTTEIDAIKQWVNGGGALLLCADHHPFGTAAAPLAQAFSVGMSGGWCDDPANFFPGTADSGAIAFSRSKGMLGEHPIMTGHGSGERIDKLITFTGQSLTAPQEAAALLRLADTALDRIPVSSTSVTTGNTTKTTFQTKDASAAGRCQGLAMSFGKGRVVVLGEAGMLSAQIDDRSGLKFGMNVPGADNRQFVLNTVRWLAGELE
jgi:hypothetical protein